MNKITDFCTGCGTCVSVCQQGAISLVKTKGYCTAKIDTDKCNECGLCRKVCPKLEKPQKETYKPISIVKGYAKDQHIRFKATSGGIVTVLLAEMLKEGEIDAALVVRKKKEADFISFEPYWAKDAQAVISSSGSAYQPVALNTRLSEIKRFNKIAVVGLPCHIQGVRKYLELYPKAKARVRVIIGLTCSHNISRLGTKFLLKSASVSRLEDIFYRGNGWPGGVRLIEGHKEHFFHNLHSLWNDIFASFCFCPPYCLRCDDDLAEYSDINVSDAWLKEELSRKENIGSSIITVWTNTGKELLNKYQDLFDVKEITLQDLENSQKYPLFFKKYIFSNRAGVISHLIFVLIRVINFISFSKPFQLLPINIQILYIKLSRQLIYKSLRLSSKGRIYFANN
jgi:coenzyme F420 hydrogenase subunit beta